MELQEILYSQGFGPRRVCLGLVQGGLVTINGQTCQDPYQELQAEGLQFTVEGESWSYHAKAYLMLHKPLGYECSQKPSAWPSIYTLLPAPLRQRPVKGGTDGVQAIGRLDQDTTGLLLLSDDGAFIHKMSSPKRHVPKVYEVGTDDPVTDTQVQDLLKGVTLMDDPKPVRAA
jgi:16S rRNA pseudouridine516 synthase